MANFNNTYFKLAKHFSTVLMQYNGEVEISFNSDEQVIISKIRQWTQKYKKWVLNNTLVYTKYVLARDKLILSSFKTTFRRRIGKLRRFKTNMLKHFRRKINKASVSKKNMITDLGWRINNFWRRINITSVFKTGMITYFGKRINSFWRRIDTTSGFKTDVSTYFGRRINNFWRRINIASGFKKYLRKSSWKKIKKFTTFNKKMRSWKQKCKEKWTNCWQSGKMNSINLKNVPWKWKKKFHRKGKPYS